MARSAQEDEELNALYKGREAMEDSINSMPGNRKYEEFKGWVGLTDKIEEMIAPSIGEERRLQSLLSQYDKQVEYWTNLRDETREKLGEIYEAEHPVECDCPPNRDCIHAVEPEQDEEFCF